MDTNINSTLVRAKTLRMKCDKHKHTLRTNAWGVTWCIGCGLLSSSIAQPLKKEEILIFCPVRDEII